MQAVILAAGKGKRLQPLTLDKPKALAPLSKQPLLWHVLDSLEKAGIEEAIIVTGFLGEQIPRFFGSHFKGMQLSYVEQKQQLGTAHALLQTHQVITGDFVMGHCDVIASPFDWKRLVKTSGFDCVMMLRREKKPQNFGAVETEGDFVVGIEEKPEKPKSNLVNAACYKFSPAIFEALEKTKINLERHEFELTDTLRNLAQEKKVGFVLAKEKIFDISTLEELKKAEKEIG